MKRERKENEQRKGMRKKKRKDSTINQRGLTKKEREEKLTHRKKKRVR